MSLTQASSFNELLANIIIEELFRNKIDTFFISPGSRSTPLTSSVASNKKLKKHIHFDERGSAFAALGYARATGKPSVLICTSGSAGANYFPAICEASADSVPLIVLTADRPPELHNVLANQTMSQQNLFGDKVKAFYNIEPFEKNSSLKEILSNVSSLIQQATTVPTGVVHINCMFREPLVFKNSKKDYSKYTSEISNWLKSDKPFQKKKIDKSKLSLGSQFTNSVRTFIIAGALKTKKEADAVVKFAEAYNLPVFADIRSGIRMSHKSKNIISYYDQFLLTTVLDSKKSYQVLHVGGNIVSKRLLLFIEKANIEKYLVLHNYTNAYNPHHKMTESYLGSIEKMLRQLPKQVEPFDKKFLNDLISCNAKLKSTIEKHDYKFSEISITRVLSQEVKNNSFICSANSLSVRLLDMYADSSDKNIQLVANRGLSGIDGTIATAVGYADGSRKGGTLLIGDLAFQHDLNSLALLKKSTQPMVIVLLNNNGGKIFSYLPIAQNKEIYTDYFETPQNISFENIAKQHDLPYNFVSSTRQFREIYKKRQTSKQSAIIEIGLQDSNVIKEQKKIEKEIKKLGEIL